MAYIDKPTMLGSCNADTGDAPGQPANTKFIAPGEDLSTSIANRPHLQLAENCDVLAGRCLSIEGRCDDLEEQMADDKCYPEVGKLLTFTGNSIDIDPSGTAAGDINYTGKLYLGESTWSGQEYLDTLFEILDENYNEVIVDDVEVKVTSLSGNALGDEFVQTLTTLNLNKTLPSGDYRIIYSRGTTLGTLEPYALIMTSIRSAQEIEAQVQTQLDALDERLDTVEGDLDTAEEDILKNKTFITCGPVGSNANYTGATAVSDAITAGSKYIFIKAGTYDAVSSSSSDVTIVGERRDTTIIKGLTLTGSYYSIYNIRLQDVATPGYESVIGTMSLMENCYINQCLKINSNCVFRNIYFTSSSSRSNPYNYYLKTSNTNVSTVTFEKCVFFSVYAYYLLWIAHTGCGYYYFESCSIATAHATDGSLKLDEDFNKVYFNNCTFGGFIKNTTESGEISFSNSFIGYAGGLINTDKTKFEFIKCKLENTSVSEYTDPFIKIVNSEKTYKSSFIDCEFIDNYCYGGSIGSAFDIMQLYYCDLTNCKFLRSTVGEILRESSFIYLDNCNVRNFYCEAAIPGVPTISGTTGRLFYIIDSTVENFEFLPPRLTSLQAFFTLLRSEVSGVVLINPGGDFGSKETLFDVDERSTLSNVILDDSTIVMDVTTYNPLITIKGNYSSVRDCYINLPDTARYSGIINLPSFNNADYVTIENNNIILATDGSNPAKYVINVPGASEYIKIKNNKIVFPYAPGKGITGEDVFPIRFGTYDTVSTAKFVNICNNFIKGIDHDGSHAGCYIMINSADLTYGDPNGGSGLVITYENILVSTGSYFPAIAYINTNPCTTDTNHLSHS